MCDGREDCSDGGDEQYCNFICYNMQTIGMEVGSILSDSLTETEVHRKFVTKFPTVLKERMRIIARLIWIYAFRCFVLMSCLLHIV